MKKIFWTILVLSLILGQTLLPGSRKIKFEHITLADGLSQNTANCILQDQKGFMWFGTEDGLNRYDGYKFKTYNSDPDDPRTLSVNYMRTIYEDRSGTIWVGTYGGGLNKFNRSRGSFSRYVKNPDNPHSLNHNDVRAICEDRSGVLWIGTYGGGLDKFDTAAERFDHYIHEPGNNDSLSHNEVMALLEDSSGDLWVGTNDGLDKFDRDSGRFVHYHHEPGNPRSLGHNKITVIFEDHGGTLWIGTNGGGLNKFNPAQGDFTRFINDPGNPESLSSSQVNAIYEDAGGTFWVGTNGGGLNRFDRETGQAARYLNIPTDPDSLSTNNVRAIYEDRSGVLWVSTYTGGLNKRNRKKERFNLYKAEPGNLNSLSSYIVWSILEDRQGILWIGTEDGLNRFNRKTQRFTHYKNKPGKWNSLSNNQVRSIYEDSAGTLWVGTDGGGLNKLNPGASDFTRYQHDPAAPHSLSFDTIRPIYEDKKGDFWVGTYGGGLNKLDRSTGRFTHYRADPEDPHSLSHDFVYVILEDSRDNFWVGTWGGGLNKLDRQTGEFTRFQNAIDNPKSLSNDLILSLYEDKEGTLWIGTSGGGLNKFDRQSETFTHYRQKDGLPNDVIYGILEDDQGRLWLSTNKGISGFDPGAGVFKNYSVIDGLQSNEFNGGAYHKSRSGEMFFGGINGFNAFFPAEIVEEEQFIPPIVITAFLINNQEVAQEKAISETDLLRLSYKDNFITFEFSALDFTAPERNKYAYKLEGFNEEFIQTNSQKRFATYTRLSAGDYVFRVKGTNHDGKWNETGTSLKIKIVAPFWETSWFQALMYLSAIALIIYIAWIREKAQKKAQLEKELKLKADFTAMLVHDLRSPLTSIMGYAEMMSATPEIINLEKTGEIILKSSEKMLNIINDMLVISKFEAGKMSLNKSYATLNAIVEDSVHIMQPMLEMKQFKIKYDFAPLPQLFIDSEKIAQVVNNFLSNAAKFSPEKGTITIETKEIVANGSRFQELTVYDEGPGVAAEKEPLLFNKYSQLHKDTKIKGTGLGLAVSKWIINSHRGEIGYRPRPEGGSIFYFRLQQQRK